MKTTRFLFFLLPIVAICSCNKDHEQPPSLNGKYTGKFFSFSQGKAEQYPIGFSLSEGQFENLAAISQLTAGHGTYQPNVDSLKFSSKEYFTLEESTEHPFLGEAALTGSYKYTFKGDSLFLSRTVNASTITYKMKKI